MPPFLTELRDRATEALQALTGKRDAGPEWGFGGARITGGIVNDEHVAELSGRAAITTAVRMRRGDTQVRAVSQVMSLPIRSTTWLVEEPQNAGGAEKEAAALLRENLLGGMESSWDDALRLGTLATYYGWQVPEIVWTERRGVVWIQDLASRNLENVEQWLYHPDGRLAGYLYAGNRPIGDGVPRGRFASGQATNAVFERVGIPIEKALHFVYDGEGGNPQGFGVWRSMRTPWMIKEALVKIMAIGTERNLLDVPVGRLKNGATAADRSKFMTILRRWRAAEDAAVILTDDQKLELIGSSRPLMDGLPFLHWLNFQIAQGGLCAFLNLGQSSAGTQALGSELVKVFQDAENANARWIADTLNQQLARRWTLLNYGEGVRPPRITFRPIRSRDLAAWANALNTLSTGGFLHATVDDEERFRDELELPEVPKEQLEKAERERKAALPTPGAIAPDDGTEGQDGDGSEADS